MTTIHEVSYGTENDQVVVGRASEATTEVAHDVLRIMSHTYAAQFEGPDTEAQLPRGTFAKQFRYHDAEAVERQQARMSTYIAAGAEYWFAKAAGVDDGARVGLVKASPSRASLPQKARLAAPNLFVNDVAVLPNLQGFSIEGEDQSRIRRYIGSKLLYTVVEFGNYKQDGPVSLDAYVQNSRVNSWYFDLSFWSQPSVAVEPLSLPDNSQLEQQRMEAPTLRGVAQLLRRKVPELAGAQAKK